MKVLSIIGTRPQYIKEAVLSRHFRKAGITEILVDSGQHYDLNMSGIFLEKLSIPTPHYNLQVGSGTHGETTAKVMLGFEQVVVEEKPDFVLVYGDTNTTLAGALVAAKLKVPVAHIEAGIRMIPKDMPEEINRVLTDRISTYLFCASRRAVDNLAREGITDSVYFTGDVMYDLFLMMQEDFSDAAVQKLGLHGKQYAVCTLHRDFNVDSPERLKRILKQLTELSRHLHIVLPIHPRTRKRCTEFGVEDLLDNLLVVEPLDYLELMGLVRECRCVITDSGGLQKEAYFAGKAAYLFMEDPAWHELVEQGYNHLIGEASLTELVLASSEKEVLPGIYGDGNAGQQTIDILLNKL